jgi:ankyrin repeat protein
VISDIIRRVNCDDIFPLKESQRKDGALDDHFITSVRDEHYDNMLVFYTLGANIEARDMVIFPNFFLIFSQQSKYRGSTALHIACSKGNLKAVQFLLGKGAQISARTGTHPADFSSIHFAARGGHDPVISILVDNGADVDIKCNPNGCKDWTALHLSSRNGRTSAVELLIQKGILATAFGNLRCLGANVNAPAEEERMGPGTFGPAYLAVFYGQEECAVKLIEAGAKIEGNADEHYLIHAAAKGSQVSITRMLLKRGNAQGDIGIDNIGANINALDSNKQTALHIAAAHGCLELVKLLANFQVEENWNQLEKLDLEEQVKAIVDLNAEDKR